MIDLDVQLAAIAAGDPDAFGRWVAGAEPTLRASLRTFAAQVDAEAVLQEALLRVWQVAPRCSPDGKPNALFRLALRICRNLAIDELRRDRSVGIDEQALAALVVDDPHPPDPLLRQAIADCREALPDKPQAALAARLETAGAEPDETLAARLHMKLNTFLQNIGRARKLLVACLERRGIRVGEEA